MAHTRRTKSGSRRTCRLFPSPFSLQHVGLVQSGPARLPTDLPAITGKSIDVFAQVMVELSVAVDEDRTLRRFGPGKDHTDLEMLRWVLDVCPLCSVPATDNPASTRDGSFGKMWGLELTFCCTCSPPLTRPACAWQVTPTRSAPRAQLGRFAGSGQNFEKMPMTTHSLRACTSMRGR